MKYTMRRDNGNSYGEAQALGEGDGSLADIRRVVRCTFDGCPTVTKRNGRVDIHARDGEYGVFVEPHTHPDD